MATKKKRKSAKKSTAKKSVAKKSVAKPRTKTVSQKVANLVKAKPGYVQVARIKRKAGKSYIVNPKGFVLEVGK